MIIFLQIMDLLIIIFAMLSGWLWFNASRKLVRRISKHEQLDSIDLNRIIVAMNRTQMLNARAALATAAAATLAGLRIALGTLPVV
jgi:uncharacterized protein with ACT and thioredoxin-like domain